MNRKNFTESQSFFNKYMRHAMQSKRRGQSDAPIQC